MCKSLAHAAEIEVGREEGGGSGNIIYDYSEDMNNLVDN